MAKWNDILKIKVEDSPIGDLEQYERDAVSRDSELEDYRYEGWPENKQELKEVLERDGDRLMVLSQFYKIMGNRELARKILDTFTQYRRLLRKVDEDFPEDKLTGITEKGNPYYQILDSPPYWTEWNKLQDIKGLLNQS